MFERTKSNLKFHWAFAFDSGQKSATSGYDSGSIDLDGIIDFAQTAERSGITSLLMGISYHMPDPIPLIGILARETQKIDYILAYRPGLLSPTLFSQIVNTISWLNNKRLALNIVAGISPEEQAFYGDFCDHDKRYQRADEFLSISRGLWRADVPMSFDGDFYRVVNAELGVGYKDNGSPKIYISGGSPSATKLAIKHGQCLLRYGDIPENLISEAEYLNKNGCSLGIRMHVVARASRQEALDYIADMLSNPDEEHKAMIAKFVAKCDSHAVKKSFDLAASTESDWLSPMVWSGAVPYRGGPALAIVGSYDEVAQYLNQYRLAGVAEFILSGWPTRDEMERFCQEVLPRVREIEANAEATCA